mmetsp:Transcript_32830/g.55367  ORF Transcript_32830/g.55367 Transcript_32830/m.55367 type:complete len:369 (-) Transcript_32830:120-1226(-)|eukprot:CAMPEP_0174957314 /NCGR_PEP_ID=MMETSP0004_2-20121128/2006_1 /TAXON_ID=420556 /ORGANISM="Ochromonas sp., Strain CCMP1393" /LENGTH=368 /DNA_ID=CAMNT_0016205415 /DNA_START=36 /DNA_END=1142 /DNA_ORIENTATION=+
MKSSTRLQQFMLVVMITCVQLLWIPLCAAEIVHIDRPELPVIACEESLSIRRRPVSLVAASIIDSEECTHIDGCSDSEKLKHTLYPSNLIALRGGQAISGKKKKSPLKKGMEVLAQVLPATRVYLLLSLFCTLVHITGLPAPKMFAVDMSRIYELWRPFTSVAYLGAPSMSMANSLYFLLRYGQNLEGTNGTGVHAWFLLVQTMILATLGMLFGFPSLAQAMIAATIYASSRVNAMEKVPIQFGLVVTSWQLPYCMMIIDCLSQQSAGAAWPHILGIFSGHFYHFFTDIWPKLGGREWLKASSFLVKKLGGKPQTNIKGMDFRKNKDDGEDDSSSSSKRGKRSKKRVAVGKKNKKYNLASTKKGRKLG